MTMAIPVKHVVGRGPDELDHGGIPRRLNSGACRRLTCFGVVCARRRSLGAWACRTKSCPSGARRGGGVAELPCARLDLWDDLASWHRRNSRRWNARWPEGPKPMATPLTCG